MSEKDLRRKALLLVCLGEAWNVLEAGVALWSAIGASSVALLAYGLDSLIEIFAGFVLIWRLQKEPEEEEATVDKKALRLVGITFFLLAIFVLAQSLATLLGWLSKPKESPLGIGPRNSECAGDDSAVSGEIEVSGETGISRPARRGCGESDLRPSRSNRANWPRSQQPSWLVVG